MKMIKELLKKNCKKIAGYGKKRIAIALSAVFVLSLIMTVYTGIKTSYIDYMIVTLNYEGAKKGLNPDGSRFQIADIKSDKVLKDAINKLGDNSLSVDDIHDRISIDSKMPLSAIEKTSSAIASGTNYRYNPSEFDIYYSQKKKLGKNNTVAFLHALSEAYNEYFLNKYSEKNIILEFEMTDEFKEYDYYEKKRVLTEKINSMISYLGKHQEESPTFRATATGYSFENLTNMLINLRDQDLDKLEAYIVQNKVSSDRGGFIRKQEYLIEKSMLRYNSNMQSAEITRQALELYDPYITGIAFIPSVDGNDEYYMSRTKTGLDNLAVKSYNYGITANDLKKEIDRYGYLSGKFSGDGDVSAEKTLAADEMIEAACDYLEKISSVAVLTDSEYLSYKTKDYITFTLPEEAPLIPVIDFVKYFVVLLVLLFVGVKMYSPAMSIVKKKYKRVETIIEEKLNLKTEEK